MRRRSGRFRGRSQELSRSTQAARARAGPVCGEENHRSRGPRCSCCETDRRATAAPGPAGPSSHLPWDGKERRRQRSRARVGRSPLSDERSRVEARGYFFGGEGFGTSMIVGWFAGCSGGLPCPLVTFTLNLLTWTLFGLNCTSCRRGVPPSPALLRGVPPPRPLGPRSRRAAEPLRTCSGLR